MAAPENKTDELLKAFHDKVEQFNNPVEHHLTSWQDVIDARNALVRHRGELARHRIIPSEAHPAKEDKRKSPEIPA